MCSGIFVFKEKAMKKVLVSVIAASAIILSGCSNDKPLPTPLPTAPSVLPSETVSGWPTPPNITRPPQETSEPDQTQNPDVPSKPEETKPAPTTSGAVPPAIEFAQRWGAKYPNVPEYAILKTANATCEFIAKSGVNWNDNTVTMAAISGLLSGAGINDNEALEFAQDAEQNYCSSVSNPT
jgi:hypothetical protein